MNKNTYENLTDEQLIKKRNLLRASIGLGIVVIIAIGILICLYAAKGFKKIQLGTLIPVFALPLFCLYL